MDAFNAGTKQQASDQQNGTSSSTGHATNRTSAAEKHLSGLSSSSHSHALGQMPSPRSKGISASRTSGIADPYDLSTEEEVLHLGLESDRRASRRDERERGDRPRHSAADPDAVFRPEQYQVASGLPPFLRGKKGYALTIITILVVVGVTVGTILATKRAKPRPNPPAGSSAAFPITATSLAVSTEILTETFTVHDGTLTSSPTPAPTR